MQSRALSIVASMGCHGRPRGVKRGKGKVNKNSSRRLRIVKEVKGLIKDDVNGRIQVRQVGTNCIMWNQVGKMFKVGSSGIGLLQVE